MKKILAAFLLFLCVFAAASEIKIATFNVENLFDGKNDGSEYKDFVIGKSDWNVAQASKKLSLVATKIKELNADVIALQEIENEAVLKELMRASGYSYFAFSKGKNAPVGLGFLSRIKPVKTQIYAVPNVKTRDIVRLDFEVSGQKFSVFTLHFPARKNPYKQRKTAFITLKSALADTKNAIVLGDFNTPYNDELIKDVERNKDMANLWSFLPKDQIYSHITLSAIDNVLLSKSLLDSYVPNSFAVVKKGNEEGQISDHFPLVFKLNFSSVKAGGSSGAGELQNTPQSSTAELSTNLKFPVMLKEALVIYKDKKGFMLAQNGRGFYVYAPKNDVIVGQVIDVVVNSVGEFKGNLEISSHYVAKIYDKMLSPESGMLEAKDLPNAKSGDVIRQISGEVRNGRLYTPFGEIRIYSKKGRVPNAKSANFKAVRVVNFKGEPQIWIENADH